MKIRTKANRKKTPATISTATVTSNGVSVEFDSQLFCQLFIRRFRQRKNGLSRTIHAKPQFQRTNTAHQRLEFHLLDKLQFRHAQTVVHELHDIARPALLHNERKFRARRALQIIQFPHCRQIVVVARPQIRQAKQLQQRNRLVLKRKNA